ncbi:MAG: PEGA domain-containing protein [Patescibacteria group bacterium]|nr:PEGA domain-containing protein [Patescibacteria group bacterium]
MAILRNILGKIILIVIFSVILFLIVATARGYRFNFKDRTITSTGIISVNSAPEAAKILVNGELKGVTNQNITLPPGNYDVRISKEGFTEWHKNITVRGEVVVSIDAVLFPRNPSLSPLTNLGVSKAMPVGESGRVLVFAQNNDPLKDGIYLLEAQSRRLSPFSPLKLLMLSSLLPPGTNLASTEAEFSADFGQGLFTFVNEDTTKYTYLLSLEGNNTEPLDVTASKAAISAAWNRQKQKNLLKILETFPRPIRNVATDSFRIIAFSPDETKILYQSLRNIELPLSIKPRLIGTNQSPEQRELKTGEVYVYDRKEDRNYQMPLNLERITPPETKDSSLDELTTEEVPLTPEPESTLSAQLEISGFNNLTIADYVQWYPSSQHLVINENSMISIIQYDGTNKQPVYAGPYDPTFFATNPDWKLIVLSNLNPQVNRYGDIYEIGIR